MTGKRIDRWPVVDPAVDHDPGPIAVSLARVDARAREEFPDVPVVPGEAVDSIGRPVRIHQAVPDGRARRLAVLEYESCSSNPVAISVS